MKKKRLVYKKTPGRNRVTIDWNVVDTKLKKACTIKEIAQAVGVCPDTLYARVQKEKGCTYSDYSASFRALGDACLREKYYDMAMAGNVKLLENLGRERLGYGKQEIAVTADISDTFKKIAHYYFDEQDKNSE